MGPPQQGLTSGATSTLPSRTRQVVGIEGEPASFGALHLTLSYWKRAALADAISSFRSGGLTAIAGIATSTVASVRSVYLEGGTANTDATLFRRIAESDPLSDSRCVELEG